MKTIADILKKNNSPLAKLINKLKSSQDLEIIFHTALDASLAKHCHFANYKNSELTVTVSNTSWATRLRFAIPDIIKQLQIQPEFKTLTSIRYTVISPQMLTIKSKSPGTKLSSNNEILWQRTLADLKEKNKMSTDPN